MPTNAANFSLEIIDVATPCTAEWSGMQGDDRIRHCDQCDMNVYNLAEMSRSEAEALVKQHEGRLCVRFYRRADGTVMTRDCPLGIAAMRRRLLRAWGTIAALVTFLFAGTLFARYGEDRASERTFDQLRAAITPEPPPPMHQEVAVQGAMMAPVVVGELVLPINPPNPPPLDAPAAIPPTPPASPTSGE